MAEQKEVFLPEGQVNRLMAGAGLKKASRASYTSAGYVYDEELRESELLIERVQAGSAQDLLRDNNRIGYSAEERDSDGLPFSFVMEEQREQPARKTKKEREVQLTLSERLVRAVRRERAAVAVCSVLLVLNIILLSFWGQAMIDGVRLSDKIEAYDQGIDDYELIISDMRTKIDQATNDERVRNVAQNELGMLRRERVATEKIYIQTAGITSSRPAVADTEESAGWLDWLLSVADIFDFS